MDGCSGTIDLVAALIQLFDHLFDTNVCDQHGVTLLQIHCQKYRTQ